MLKEDSSMGLFDIFKKGDREYESLKERITRNAMGYKGNSLGTPITPIVVKVTFTPNKITEGTALGSNQKVTADILFRCREENKVEHAATAANYAAAVESTILKSETVLHSGKYSNHLVVKVSFGGALGKEAEKIRKSENF